MNGIFIMLHIDNACIAFGEHTLFSGFCMHLANGESACIVGASGCGKSSLLNAIMGFVPLKQGSITVGNLQMERTTVDAIRKMIAWIPQELALPEEWVRQMIALPWSLKANKAIPFSEEKLFACFDELGLSHDLYLKRVNDISIGQRQRIMLAVAAMLDKPFIIVDEPTSALDPAATDRVLGFFQRETERGKTVLAVSHNRKFALGCHQTIEL